MIIPPQAYLIGGALALAAAGYGGWQVRDWQADSDALEAREDADRALQEAIAQRDEQSTAYEAQRAETAVSGQNYATQTRIVYRDIQVSPDCAVTGEPLRVFDAAAAATGAVASQPSAALPVVADATGTND